MRESRFAQMRRHAVCAIVAGALLATGCTRRDVHAREVPSTASAASTAVTEAPKSKEGRYSLGIVGYNYTETSIADFRVNGTGAFNLAVSSETAGGGSTTCCAGWAPATELPLPVVVEWTRDGDHWCRATAILKGPVPLEPTTLEVHIFPDRHVEAAITDNYSPPRLKLPRFAAAYRVAGDLRAERAAALAKDFRTAECRDAEFPISNEYYSQQLQKLRALQPAKGSGALRSSGVIERWEAVHA